MKKNLLSVLILALLLVNVILTAVTMFSVTSTNKKTATIVNQIASVLQLELSTNGTDEAARTVSIEDTVTHDIEEEMTIPLKTGEDGEKHFALVSITLSMDKTSKGYKSYGENIGDNESLLKGEIIDAFKKYTIEEVEADDSVVIQDILERFQKMFDSDFIYKVSFRSVMYQ